MTLIGLIESTMIDLTNYSKLGEYRGCKEDASIAVFS